MICSFHKPEPLQLSHQVAPPPDVPSPESLIPEEFKLENLSHDPELDPQIRLYYEHIAQVSPDVCLDCHFS